MFGFGAFVMEDLLALTVLLGFIAYLLLIVRDGFGIISFLRNEFRVKYVKT